MDIFELAKKAKKKEIDEDSNEELRERIARLERKVSRENQLCKKRKRRLKKPHATCI